MDYQKTSSKATHAKYHSCRRGDFYDRVPLQLVYIQAVLGRQCDRIFRRDSKSDFADISVQRGNVVCVDLCFSEEQEIKSRFVLR